MAWGHGWPHGSGPPNRGGPALDFRAGAVRREIQAALKLAEKPAHPNRQRAIAERLRAALDRLTDLQGL